MDKNPDYKDCLVSVITPMFNAQRYIADTIKSVINQTYTEWEMIIVDDCSLDSSPEIVKEFCKQDSRIKYYRNSSQSGPSKTRNNAISYAEGRYIAFLDSDDLWKEDKLKKQLQFMNETGAAFCYCSCDVIDENGNVGGKTRIVPERLDFKELLKGNSIPCLTVVLDRKHIQNIRMPDVRHEDYATWLDILNTGITAMGIKDVFASYRVSSSSLSANKLRSLKWTWNIYYRYLNLGLLKSHVCFCMYVFNGIKKKV